MASSRLEKIGNIFTRVQGLLKSGAMKYEDRPLFYEIYQSFPPLKERKYKETVDPSITIRPIFYAEDVDRAGRDETNTLYNLDEEKPASGRRSRTESYSTQNLPKSPNISYNDKSSDHKIVMPDLTDLKP